MAYLISSDFSCVMKSLATFTSGKAKSLDDLKTIVNKSNAEKFRDLLHKKHRNLLDGMYTSPEHPDAILYTLKYRTDDKTKRITETVKRLNAVLELLNYFGLSYSMDVTEDFCSTIAVITIK